MRFSETEARTKGQKYRPSLTADQIEFILFLTKQFYIDATSISNPDLVKTNQAFAVIATLTPFEAKIRNLAVAPAYTPAPPAPSLLESLGGTEIPPLSPIPPYDDSIGTPEVNLSKLPPVSKEEIWAASYSKYLLSPTSCTLQEIKEAREHKYLNDLMTPEEMIAFEQDLMTTISIGTKERITT